MAYQFTISPDFNANQLSPWYIFNNRLQKFLGENCHLELYDDFAALKSAEEAGKVDVIFANAFDIAYLVREKGYVAVASGAERSDEASIAVRADSGVQEVADFSKGLKVAATDAPDVEMIGRILLEPADIYTDDIEIQRTGNYVTVAKALINGDADAGFFLKRSYDELSGLIQQQLRPVVSSHIYVVQHALLVSPALADKRGELLSCLTGMVNDSSDKSLLGEMGMPNGWQAMEQEDAEFMIDMMDTLLP